MPRTGPSEPADIGFDEVLSQLRGVVGRLEEGNLSLEESLKAYEQGVTLARRGHQILDGAEAKVELLVRNERGELSTEPLDDAPARDGDPTGDSE